MRNIKINEAESIFEPFWDTGDSYPDHQKYSRITGYEINTNDAGEVRNNWCSVQIVLHPETGMESWVSMEKKCCLDICEYDRFRFYGAVPECVDMCIECSIDGIEKEIVHCMGRGSTAEYNGMIQGEKISSVRLKFRNLSKQTTCVDLLWMGLSNSEKEQKMLEAESPYTKEWEGCFCEDPQIGPQTGLYFDEKELEEIREKIKIPCFEQIMNDLRKRAKGYMQIEPEKEVGDYSNNSYRKWVRDRDYRRPCLRNAMPILAFVGLVDRDMEMLRMACRCALAMAHTTYFHESIMGNFPGATWHHRSFEEAYVSMALVEVLDWAGGLLTWHGKNIIYDAIIMKGLPRMDADIKTMDYIWKMNQGPVFASHMLIVLMALEKRYPRYATRVAEAERDLLAMWENYVQEDGGIAEGPGYWSFSMQNISSVLYLLARYHGMSLEEYVPDSVRKSGAFAEALLTGDGRIVPVNDTHLGGVHNRKVAGLMAAMNAGSVWKEMNNRNYDGSIPEANKELSKEDIIFGKLYDLETAENTMQEFINFPVTGHTVLRKDTPDLGIVKFHAISGAITFGHAHCDKGSVLLEAGDTQLLIDRGVCNYDDSYAKTILNAELHNVIVPCLDNRPLNQEYQKPQSGGKVLQADYEGGVFTYETDITPCWDGIFEKNHRKITAADPYHYVIEDVLKLDKKYSVCFVLNTYGEITVCGNEVVITDNGKKLTVIPKNWIPEKIVAEAYGTDGKYRSVNRLCMYFGGHQAYDLQTELVLG